MNILYTAEATVTGGREGKAISSDGNLDLTLSVPKEMGGPGADGATNPEQLFAAGYAGCFHSALKLIARRAKVDADNSTVTAKVGIGPSGSGGFGLDVDLVVTLPGLEQADAEQLVSQAHAVCPYSNATRGNIDVRLTTLTS